jgi:hypothetical protein
MLVSERDHPHHHHLHDHHNGETRGHAEGHRHAHSHTAHEHDQTHLRRAPSRFRSLIALSGLQRLMLALPVIVALWVMTFWAMGWFG